MRETEKEGRREGGCRSDRLDGDQEREGREDGKEKETGLRKRGREGGREGGKEGGRAYLRGLNGDGEFLKVGLLVVHEEDIGDDLQIRHLHVGEACG